MAEDKLGWYFELLDKFSPGASKIAASLEKLQKKFTGGANKLLLRAIDMMPQRMKIATIGMLSHVGRLADRISPMLSKVGGPLLKAAGYLGAGLLAVGVTAATATAGLALVGGKFALDSAMFKENSLVAFKVMLGSQQAADRVFKAASDFAARTPFDTKDVIEGYQQLLGAGFKENELNTMMSGLGDLGALKGPDAMKRSLAQISQIMSKGRLQGEELTVLSESGIASGVVLDNLAAKLGKTKDEARKLLETGKIDSKTGIVAILETINQTISGGKGLGTLMEAQANSLSGVLSTLKSRFQEFFFTADMSKVLGPFKTAILGITDLLDPEKGATGKRIVSLIEGASAALGSFFESAAASGTLERVLNGVLSAIEAIVSIGGVFMKSFGSSFMTAIKPLQAVLSHFGGPGSTAVEKLMNVFNVLGTILGVVAAVAVTVMSVMVGIGAGIWYVVGAVLGALMPAWEWLKGAFASVSQLGTALIDGLINGIVTGVPRLVEAVKSVGASSIAALKGVFGIASPSKVGFAVGFNVGESVGMGFETADPMGQLQASMPIGPTANLSAVASGAGSSTTNNSPVFNVNVDAQGATKDDANAMAQTIHDMLASRLRSAFEQMSIEAGA